MQRTPPRRFTLVDAMVLIAATAVAFAWPREIQGGRIFDLINLFARAPGGRPGADEFLTQIARLMVVPTPLALSWGLALIALRLSQPRPDSRRLSCQPGMIACCAASSVYAMELVGLSIACLLSSRRQGPRFPVTVASMIGHVDFLIEISTVGAPGFAILTCWATLAIGRRWRTEPDWIDRTGRLLGAWWIALIPVNFWNFKDSMSL